MHLEQETSIYNSNAVAEGDAQAGSTATDYIDDVTNEQEAVTGVTLHSSVNDNDYAQIDGTGLTVAVAGEDVAHFGTDDDGAPYARLGAAGAANMSITDNSLMMQAMVRGWSSDATVELAPIFQVLAEPVSDQYTEPSFTLGKRLDESANGPYSVAEGREVEASGDRSHAEGYYTTASGVSSHAEGARTEASGVDSHAGGYNAVASGAQSFAHGLSVIASDVAQAVFGAYNVDHPSGYPFIVGDGTANARHDAFSVRSDGMLETQGADFIKSAVKAYTGSGSLSAGSATTLQVDMSETGYQCLGILGIRSDKGGSIAVAGYYLDNQTAYVTIRNVASAAIDLSASGLNLRLTGLYLRDTNY